jgi:NADH:ubiquinone oxidoreductase subunit 6 (subunit J)
MKLFFIKAKNSYFIAVNELRTKLSYNWTNFKLMYREHPSYIWLSKVEPQKITKSLLIVYVATSLLKVLYINIPETAFLNLALHLFWFILNVISVLSNVFIPLCIILFSSSIIMYNNPIHSLLALIFVFFNMILVLFSLKIDFLSIMLFNLKKIYDFKRLQIYHITSMIIALCFFFKFYYIVTNSFQIHFNSDLNTQVSEFIYLKSVAESLIYFEDIVAIGANLYTATSELFLAVGYVLLVAMVGAIILALSTVKQPKIIFVK